MAGGATNQGKGANLSRPLCKEDKNSAIKSKGWKEASPKRKSKNGKNQQYP